MHAAAVFEGPPTYEHVPPETSARRRVLASDQAGKSNILAELERLGVPVARDDVRVARLLNAVKDKEAQGYAYEGADASFELLARRALGRVPDFFDVDRFRVDVERRHNAQGELETFSEATVRVTIDGQTLISAAEGIGPVHALYGALCRISANIRRSSTRSSCSTSRSASSRAAPTP